MIFQFVDIGGIVDHHCLNTPFIIMKLVIVKCNKIKISNIL